MQVLPEPAGLEPAWRHRPDRRDRPDRTDGADGPSGISNVVVRTDVVDLGVGAFGGNFSASCNAGEHVLSGGLLRGQPGDIVTSGGGVTISVEQMGPVNSSGNLLPAGSNTGVAWVVVVSGNAGGTDTHATVYALCGT